MDTAYIFCTSNSMNRPIGPYFTHYIDLIGNKTLYSRDDIEKFANIQSKTLKKRILNMREGSDVYICHLGRDCGLFLRRLLPTEIKQINDYLELKQKLKDIYQEIKKSNKELFKSKSFVEKELRKLKSVIYFDF